MLAGGDELQAIQSELQAVKKALHGGGAYLGMTGETLQRYLLQLNEKENLVLSRQLQRNAFAGDGFAPAGYPGAPPAAAPLGAPQAGAPQARPPPAAGAEARPFDKNSLVSVLTHMCDYEAVAGESAKALRALSGLAYSDAAAVGNDDRILEQVARLTAIHPEQSAVQLNAMRSICNMAYDSSVATTKLAKPWMLKILLSAMCRCTGGPADSAREAAARIISAEINPERLGEGLAPPVGKAPAAIVALFVAAAGLDVASHEAAVKLVLSLISNEVAEPKVFARSFITSAQHVRGDAVSTAGWLGIAKILAVKGPTPLPQELVELDGIKLAVSLMEAQAANGPSQLVGIEALSSMVGSRWAALQAFAEAKGIARIEAAMLDHTTLPVLQTKGVRALASGMQWREDVLEKSGYSHTRAVALTKGAMSQHVGEADLQAAALEALAKYLDKLHCVEAVRSDGGAGLVKAVMTRHMAAKGVQTWGKIVLDAIGEDRHWQPKGAMA